MENILTIISAWVFMTNADIIESSTVKCGRITSTAEHRSVVGASRTYTDYLQDLDKYVNDVPHFNTHLSDVPHLNTHLSDVPDMDTHVKDVPNPDRNIFGMPNLYRGVDDEPNVDKYANDEPETNGHVSDEPHLDKYANGEPETHEHVSDESYMDTYVNDEPEIYERVSDEPDLDKILGGRYATRGELPWQVNLLYRRGHNSYAHLCGGSIISEFWVLTAAHCGVGFDLSYVIAIVGDYLQSRPDPGEQIFLVDKFISHQNYTRGGLDNDIGLLKVRALRGSGGIVFRETVQPACLPIGDSPPSMGTELIVSGWGVIYSDVNTIPDMLKRTVLPLIARDDCQEVFTNTIPTNVFCAGYINGETDLCQGDSGGPAVYKKEDIYILYGVIAASSGCRLPNNPGMFTNITAHLSWIQRSIQLNSQTTNQRTVPSRPQSTG